MTKEFNKLDKTFNITPEVVEEEKSEVIKPEKPDRLTKDDITRDYEYTRGNLILLALFRVLVARFFWIL